MPLSHVVRRLFAAPPARTRRGRWTGPSIAAIECLEDRVVLDGSSCQPPTTIPAWVTAAQAAALQQADAYAAESLSRARQAVQSKIDLIGPAENGYRDTLTGLKGGVLALTASPYDDVLQDAGNQTDAAGLRGQTTGDVMESGLSNFATALGLAPQDLVWDYRCNENGVTTAATANWSVVRSDRTENFSLYVNSEGNWQLFGDLRRITRNGDDQVDALFYLRLNSGDDGAPATGRFEMDIGRTNDVTGNRTKADFGFDFTGGDENQVLLTGSGRFEKRFGFLQADAAVQLNLGNVESYDISAVYDNTDTGTVIAGHLDGSADEINLAQVGGALRYENGSIVAFYERSKDYEKALAGINLYTENLAGYARIAKTKYFGSAYQDTTVVSSGLVLSANGLFDQSKFGSRSGSPSISDELLGLSQPDLGFFADVHAVLHDPDLPPYVGWEVGIVARLKDIANMRLKYGSFETPLSSNQKPDLMPSFSLELPF